MRSPPPPAPQQQQTNSYGNPYSTGPTQAGANYGPGFGGFINDPTAQMGFQLGKSAVTAGQDYMEQNVCLAKHYPTPQADLVTSLPVTAFQSQR